MGGAVEVPDSVTVTKGRLGPGQMITMNLDTGKFMTNDDIKKEISTAHPYREWMDKAGVYIHKRAFDDEDGGKDSDRLRLDQTRFGWGAESVNMIIVDMASKGKEAIYSMGDDIPLAVLSSKPRLMYSYFKQRFAQVTNPAIDPYREGAVMSLKMSLGGKKSLLVPTEAGAQVIRLDSPILNDAEFSAIMDVDQGRHEDIRFNPTVVSTAYRLEDGPNGLPKAIENLCASASKNVKAGAQ